MDEIIGYQPLVNEIKELINKKQYQVLISMNAETINLYWVIGEEIYRQQQEKGWGKSIVQVLSNKYRRNHQLQRDIQQQIFGECEIFILLIVDLKNSHHWCEKLARAIIS